MRNRSPRTTGALAALLVGAIALTGCSADGDKTARDAAGPAPAPGRQQPGGQPGQQPTAGEPNRAIIHTGKLRVQVKDVDGAADRAVRIAEAAEGYVGSDQRTDDETDVVATVALRIPAAKFTDTVDQVAKLGKELGRDISAEDVSEPLVDLDARIAGMKASVKRTRALLARAETIADISTIERELTDRESALAELEARKRALSNKVEFSTLTVTFSAKAPASPPPAELGFTAGLKSGWYAFLLSVRVILTVLGALLPFLIAIAAPTLAVIYLVRRRRRRPQVAPAAATPGPPSAP
jgi:hypothetical protein